MFLKKVFKKGLCFVLSSIIVLGMASANLTVSLAGEKYFRSLPNDYLNVSSRQGSIERLSYIAGFDTKYVNVYLPIEPCLELTFR